MSKLQRIPIIFGITGHRDLRDEDIEIFEEIVTSIFQEFSQKYPNTPQIVISALADGADILVAKMAQKLQIPLHIILPYAKDEYLLTIDDKESFGELLDYADDVKIIDCIEDERGKHTHCYQLLGQEIADKTNILLALWNGVEEQSDNGGTASIVRYQRDSFGENIFDSKDGNAIYIIPTPRKREPNLTPNPKDVKIEYVGRLNKSSFENNLDKLDMLNSDLAKYKDENSSISLLERYKKFFGDRAGEKQTKYRKYMSWMLVVIGMAIIFLETMHVLNGVDELKSWAGDLIVLYFVLLMIGFFIYIYYMGRGKLQYDFVYSRGLSEAIRIQNVWNSIGLKKDISRYYLKDEPSHLTWMRIVLKNIYYLDSSHYSTFRMWIDGQISYLQKGIVEREEKYEFYEKIEYLSFIIGLLSAVGAFVLYFSELYHIISHGHFPMNWHFLVLVSGIAILSAGFIKKYQFIQSYKEERDNFREILPYFQKASDKLYEDIETKDRKLLERIVFDLGKKALIENSQWVSLHNTRRAKFEME